MKFKWFWIIVVVIVVAAVLVFLRGNEDTWIKDSGGNWVKHGNPSAPMPN